MRPNQNTKVSTQSASDSTASSSDVVILCWDAPSESEQNAQKIAAFVGATVSFVCVTKASMRGRAELHALVPRCACLIVSAGTLSKIAEAVDGELNRVSAAISSAQNAFIYGFQPTECHGAILRSISSGTLSGIEPVASEPAKFHITDGHRDLCGQLSGLSLEAVNTAGLSCFVTANPREPLTEILRLAGKPVFVTRADGAAKFYFLACEEFADLDEKVPRESHIRSWFPRLIPLMMFFRRSLEDRVWHNNHPSACFIIDDPTLKNRYGHLKYQQLAAIMRERRFSTSIAFIPWNFRRSERDVAELFETTHPSMSVCIHGCDHTEGEFAATDAEILNRKAQLAFVRMRTHRRLSGVPFDDVMVFPQGLFSAEAVSALSAAGYLAAVNTAVCPSTTPDALVLQDLLEVAITRFADFPVFGRRYPRDVTDVALDLFLGKPALAVEHHGYFRDDYQALKRFVSDVNALDERLEWTSLGNICSQASLTRTTETGEEHVRFYTNRFWLKNDLTESRTYLLWRKQTSDGRLPLVTVNGRPFDCVREGDYLKLVVLLNAQQTAEIRVLPNKPDVFGAIDRRRPLYDAGVRVRRVLSEIRDNYIDTNPVLSRIMSAVRRVRVRHPRLETGSSRASGLKRSTVSEIV